MNLFSESPKSNHVTAPGLLYSILTWNSGNLYVPDLLLTHTCIPTGRNEETTAIPEVLPAIVVDPLGMGAEATPLQGVFFMLYSKWHFLVSSWMVILLLRTDCLSLDGNSLSLLLHYSLDLIFECKALKIIKKKESKCYFVFFPLWCFVLFCFYFKVSISFILTKLLIL